jgi:hypothetical protein
MGAVVVHILILWAVIAIGLLAARLHRGLRTEPKSGEFGASLTFIASTFGLLLGLLVVFATTHYSNTRTETQTEATAIVALFDGLGGLPAAVGQPVQHEVVCYARSVAADDWRQMAPRTERQTPAAVAVTGGARGLRGLQPASDETCEASSGVGEVVERPCRDDRRQPERLSRGRV